MPPAYRLVLHDRDSIFSSGLDTVVTALGVQVLRTPVQAPQAHAFCERLLDSLRRECRGPVGTDVGQICAAFFLP